MKIKNISWFRHNYLFTDDFNTQYALAKRQGDKRFGSECKHEQVKDGRCVSYLRKVKQ